MRNTHKHRIVYIALIYKLAYSPACRYYARTCVYRTLRACMRACVRARARVCAFVCGAAVLAGRAGLGYRSEEDLADKAEDFPANY